MRYWLMKSEPDCFSIDALIASPKQTAPWDGVRNYQARNMLRDEIKPNDLVFFYHSSCAVPGIVGTMTVVKGGYPDHSAEDPENDHYDPKHTRESPRWYRVDVKLKEKFPRIVALSELRQHPLLADMTLLQRGNRLSVMPISKQHWDIISKMV